MDARLRPQPASPQLAFRFRRRGGWRKNAGRKRSPDSGVSHLRRPRVRSSQPVHVTLHVHGGLPTLRQKRAYRAIHRAFVGGCSRFGFRLVHYSVQSNHLHLLAEAPDSVALGRALKGLCVRLARGLNRVFERVGQLFPGRYHARVLKSPREVRNVLRYVLCNAWRQGVLPHEWPGGWLDPYSSGVWFDGWRGTGGATAAVFGVADARAAPLGRDDRRFLPGAKSETLPADSYLLKQGWRRHGLVEALAHPELRRSS